MSQTFFPLRVKLVNKGEAPDECCQYFYQIFSLDGNKVGAGITIPVKKGEPAPVLKSCILSTLEVEDVIKLLNFKAITS